MGLHDRFWPHTDAEVSRWRCMPRKLLQRLRMPGVRWLTVHRSAVDGEDGSSLIEFAISLSVVMTFIFVLMELCILFYSYSMISESAREGTRWAIVRGATCQTSGGTSCTATAASIKTYVLGLGFPNPGGVTMVPTATFPDGNENLGSRVKIVITYAFPIRFPFVPTQALALSTSSQMYFVQ